ncbi:MAG: hypothetical protein PHO92_03590 [Candidatus Peribacteraceae bacterium]|nr:hypothetical protein [Candidatus Peribacteraceae bacterium]
MPLYSYSARNEKGARMHGTIDADSLEEAQAAIRKQGLTPEEVFQISYDSSKGTLYGDTPQEQSPAERNSSGSPLPEAEEAAPPSWHLEEEESAPAPAQKTYYPFSDTLRLYAGWLLAWYALVYALGYYQSTRNLPFEVPYLMGIYTSPLVLSFTLASFLFLLMTSLHRLVGRGRVAGVFFSLAGIALFVLYRMNV